MVAAGAARPDLADDLDGERPELRAAERALEVVRVEHPPGMFRVRGGLRDGDVGADGGSGRLAAGCGRRSCPGSSGEARWC